MHLHIHSDIEHIIPVSFIGIENNKYKYEILDKRDFQICQNEDYLYLVAIDSRLYLLSNGVTSETENNIKELCCDFPVQISLGLCICEICQGLPDEYSCDEPCHNIRVMYLGHEYKKLKFKVISDSLKGVCKQDEILYFGIAKGESVYSYDCGSIRNEIPIVSYGEDPSIQENENEYGEYYCND